VTQPATQPATEPTSRALRAATVPLILAAGALVAAQSQINGRLAHELGSGPRAGFGAAAISFGTGLVFLVVVTALLPRHRERVRDLRRSLSADGGLRGIELVGGLFGAFLVATQGLTVATIGVALFSVAVTAGQSCSALVVDHIGLGPSGRQHWSLPRLVAASFAVVAVLLATAERLVDTFTWQLVLFAVLPFLAGAGSSVQQALNGRVARHAGPWVTTLNNFIVGTSALLVAFALSFLADGHLRGLPGTWWLYVGGMIGVTFIWLAALLVRVHGVLVLGLAMIAGQVIGAEVIETITGERHVGAAGLAAGGLTVVGVLIALAAARRGGSRT